MEKMSGSRKRGYGRKLDSNMFHVCEKLLQSPSHLRRHMLSHTGERQYYYSVNDSRGTGNDDIQKPSLKHVCPICSRPFPSSSGLSRHLHTGEKPFECEKKMTFKLMSEKAKATCEIGKAADTAATGERPTKSSDISSTPMDQRLPVFQDDMRGGSMNKIDVDSS
ncbi:zinc finger protein 28-like [Ruditapes philippinarum]|uniref:zinc finger protein 28-like n=1 Tax=Ruditapes philippinarum TaxID=129788 RepID=UPI00295C2B6A|nr:zinc finger protein 28-like [Ruditapes philippinarum]